jgi:DNA-directed RNA polymerase specialized sigma24 family protein
LRWGAPRRARDDPNQYSVFNGGSLSQQPASVDEDIEAVRPEPVPLPDNEFKDQLGQVIPHLRAFGRSLSGSRDLADDLVQETLLKAWAARKRFQAGTNMRAWTFIILRNLFSARCGARASRRMGRDHRVQDACGAGQPGPARRTRRHAARASSPAPAPA